MTVYVMATELATRQKVWLGIDPELKKQQLTSHREGKLGACLKDAGIDGMPAWELAGLHHNYNGLF